MSATCNGTWIHSAPFNAWTSIRIRCVQCSWVGKTNWIRSNFFSSLFHSWVILLVYNICGISWQCTPIHHWIWCESYLIWILHLIQWWIGVCQFNVLEILWINNISLRSVGHFHWRNTWVILEYYMTVLTTNKKIAF